MLSLLSLSLSLAHYFGSPVMKQTMLPLSLTFLWHRCHDQSRDARLRDMCCYETWATTRKVRDELHLMRVHVLTFAKLTWFKAIDCMKDGPQHSSRDICRSDKKCQILVRWMTLWLLQRPLLLRCFWWQSVSLGALSLNEWDNRATITSENLFATG